MFDILYQDEYLVAMDKPPGLLVHRTRKAKELRTYALQGLKAQIGRFKDSRSVVLAPSR